MFVCDVTVNAAILAEATTETEALKILEAHFNPLGVSIKGARHAEVLLARLEQARILLAWIPAD
jgi:hypothetical protein